jgi:hypothetical protein
MYFSTVVKLIVDDHSAQPLSGVKVSLHDRDTFTPDDQLGTQVTDANGEASFEYTSDDFVGIDDRLTGEMPDLYVTVEGHDGETIHSSRAETVPNLPQKELTVRLSRELVIQHNLAAGA